MSYFEPLKVSETGALTFSQTNTDPPVSYRVKTNCITRFLTSKNERVFFIKEPSLGAMGRLDDIEGFYNCLEEDASLTKWQAARITAWGSRPIKVTRFIYLIPHILLVDVFTFFFAKYLYYKLSSETLSSLAKITRVKTRYDLFNYAVVLMAIERPEAKSSKQNLR